MEKILAALQVGLSLYAEAAQVLEQANALIAKARSEGREITDDELAGLTQARSDALTKFHQRVDG